MCCKEIFSTEKGFSNKSDEWLKANCGM